MKVSRAQRSTADKFAQSAQAQLMSPSGMVRDTEANYWATSRTTLEVGRASAPPLGADTIFAIISS